MNAPAGASYCGCAAGTYGSVTEYHSSTCENCASGRFGRGGSANDQCTGACPGAAAGSSVCGEESEVGDQGSLRGKITTAKGNAGNWYWVKVTQDIQLTGGLTVNGAKIAIVGGTGGVRTMLRRDSGGNYRIFTIQGSAEVYLENLLIVNG